MRIVSGSAGRLHLKVPKGHKLWPTTDQVKEAIFNILTSRFALADITILDLFAGTGSLGIEALSRGAASCCFIENNASVKTVLEKNIRDTGCQQQSVIMNMDAVKALHVSAGRGCRYDLVFFDPPYESELYMRVPEALESLGLLEPGSIMVAECAVRRQLPESYGCLRRIDRRVYGETVLELFAREEA